MRRAIGISVHTGWGACVVVSGTVRVPMIHGNQVIHVVTGESRFCFHRAADMPLSEAPAWLAALRETALERTRHELGPLLHQVDRCAIVAKEGELPRLADVVSSHLSIHSAEGMFYRDIFRDACRLPTRVAAPAALDLATLSGVRTKPWGRDQKLATAAALQALARGLAEDEPSLRR